MTATQTSYMQLIAAEPVLSRIAPLGELISDLPPRSLFHAGPPYTGPEQIPPAVLNGIGAAAIIEGWIKDVDDVPKLLQDGRLQLLPAQDIGLVTPLAFVVGPSVYCLEVMDAKRPDLRRLSPLNDGPLPDALRFGTGRTQGIDLLQRLTSVVGPDLARHFRKQAPLLPLLAVGLAGGDDLHGHVAAAQIRLSDLFDGDQSADSTAFMSAANQFVLNIIMATAALMIGAGAGVGGSNMVVAAGGNGVAFGYKLAARPDDWIMLPAERPIGPKFPGKEAMQALPAIGDSAVIDALGFGAACLRFCPTLLGALDGHIDPAFFTVAAHEAFIGPHPALPDASIHVGLDLTRPRSCLGIMLGMVGATGTEGIVGRGVAPWPCA